jgi:MOSC domain-containing protein
MTSESQNEAFMTEQVIGRLTGLWRYPVQSLQGEALATASLTATGIPGDRLWGVLNPAENKTAAAARGKKPWRDLIQWQACLKREPSTAEPLPPVEIRLPDGGTIDAEAGDRDARISAAIGEETGLIARTPENQTYGYAPLHILTSASLKAFARHYPAGRFAPQRFRPNLLIDCGETEGFIEQDWIGATLLLGESRLEVHEHCDRCILTTLPQGDLPLDPGILKTTSEANGRRAGVYAKVTVPGRIRTGDELRLLRPVSRSAA